MLGGYRKCIQPKWNHPDIMSCKVRMVNVQVGRQEIYRVPGRLDLVQGPPGPPKKFEFNDPKVLQKESASARPKERFPAADRKLNTIDGSLNCYLSVHHNCPLSVHHRAKGTKPWIGYRKCMFLKICNAMIVFELHCPTLAFPYKWSLTWYIFLVNSCKF